MGIKIGCVWGATPTSGSDSSLVFSVLVEDLDGADDAIDDEDVVLFTRTNHSRLLQVGAVQPARDRRQQTPVRVVQEDGPTATITHDDVA